VFSLLGFLCKGIHIKIAKINVGMKLSSLDIHSSTTSCCLLGISYNYIMPTNVDKAAKAAKKAAREEACAKAKLWSESLKGKGGGSGGTNVKSTNAAKKSDGKSTPKKSTSKKQSAATSKTTTNPTPRKTPSRASRKAAALENAAKWHDSRQAKGASKGTGIPTQIKVETVYPEDEVDDELSNEDDFKTANQGGTPIKATPPIKVAHTPTSMAKGQEELIMLKHDVKNIYNRLSLLCDTNVDDAMDCS